MSSSVKQRPSPTATQVVRKYVRPDFRFVFRFDFPSTLEALAVKILRNLTYFGLFYAMIMWIGLSISLMPMRMTTLFILLLMTLVTNSFLILLRLMPNPVFVHGVEDKAIVLSAFGVVTTVALILNDALIHMLLTLAIGIPLVVAHAVLWRDDLGDEMSKSYGEEALTGEVAGPLVEPGHVEVYPRTK